jgi:hypothetical protein
MNMLQLFTGRREVPASIGWLKSREWIHHDINALIARLLVHISSFSIQELPKFYLYSEIRRSLKQE